MNDTPETAKRKSPLLRRINRCNARTKGAPQLSGEREGRGVRLTALLLLLTLTAQAQQCFPQKDWKRAIWRVPLHIALSVPIAASSLIVPPLGKKYVAWRTRAERADDVSHRDTQFKAKIDLYSQTALVKATLRLYGIKD